MSNNLTKKLAGKVALVTGGSRGIGLAETDIDFQDFGNKLAT